MGIESDPDARARVKALRQRLGELGWLEDRNTRIDVVWGAADADHVRADAAELMRESPDVIVTNGPVVPDRLLAIADEVIEKVIAIPVHVVCCGA